MKYILGIDTSNYTTSVAVIDENLKIIEDRRKQITVKEGMKGIRQSEALFQHMENLPELLDMILLRHAGELDAVCVSSKPRPVKGSYMPVFKAGLNAGKLIADSLGIPLIKISHQEGHVESGKYPKSISNEGLAVFHLSGGTTEILYDNKIVGGTNDIAFGQLIDRMGVNAGMSFPAGKELDELACNMLDEIDVSFDDIEREALHRFKPISRNRLTINLSGLDTQIKRLIEADHDEIKSISAHAFYLIASCLKSLTTDLKKQYNIRCVLYVGGVSSSKFIRTYLSEKLEEIDLKVHFGSPGLSVDNAVGAALIGGRKQWL